MAMMSVGELITHCFVAPEIKHGWANGSHMPIASFCPTPHEVDLHFVPSKVVVNFMPSPTHQPRSWSKAEAEANM